MTTTFVRGLQNYRRKADRGVIATLGTFDGIHLGHREIFRTLREESQSNGLEPVLVTFHPHPKVVVSPDHIPMLLTTIEEKEKFTPHFLDGRVLVLEFNDELRKKTAEQFVVEVLVEKIGVKKLIVGYDHAFGKDRSGNIEELKKLGLQHGFDVIVVDPVIVEGVPVSSTRIRRAMQDNRYDEAIRLLGHEYAIYGEVERGIGLGRKLGYPTANVKYSPRKLLPPEGVYSCRAQVAGIERNGMMFIGTNHFSASAGVSVEANLFNFDQDIYDQEIIVYPSYFVRSNHKFDSTDALVRQIEQDKTDIQKLTNKGEKECR